MTIVKEINTSKKGMKKEQDTKRDDSRSCAGSRNEDGLGRQRDLKTKKRYHRDDDDSDHSDDDHAEDEDDEEESEWTDDDSEYKEEEEEDEEEAGDDEPTDDTKMAQNLSNAFKDYIMSITTQQQQQQPKKTKKRQTDKYKAPITRSKTTKRKGKKDDEDESDEEGLVREVGTTGRTRTVSGRKPGLCAKERSSFADHDVPDETESDDDEGTNEEMSDGENDDDANIISIILGGGLGDEEEEEIQQMLNDDNEDCNSEDEKTFMKEDYEKVLVPEQEPDKRDIPNHRPTKKDKPSKHNKQSSKLKKGDESEEEEPILSVEDEYKELVDLKKHLSEKLQRNPKSKILLSAMKDCKDSIAKLVKKARTKNAKDYYKLIKTERDDQVSEIDYFKKKLSHKEQKEIMQELQLVNDHMNIDVPYRLKLLQTKMPAKYKSTILNKLNIMQSMEPGDTEYHKMKTWVDTFMRVPFNTYKNLSVSITDGLDACDTFMKNAINQLDECVYGLHDAKLQILQVIGQWLTNSSALGQAIAISGPPGSGKTSIVRDGISKILGREFAFIALGGAGDSSFLEGHSYTYEGSTWGKIVQILIDSKCMNPVIFFDELDKLSDTPRGQEITGILTHLTDTSQNSQFHDKYFSEVDFDLSKCLFIFSYNDENLVNPILKDRMYKIHTKGYNAKEKVIIARKYMLPKIREQVNFNEEDVVIPDETIKYIVNTPKFTQNEQGVRNLKRCLEIIHTKLNLFRLMRIESPEDMKKVLGKEVNFQVTFPFTVTNAVVDSLITVEENLSPGMLAMYV